MGSSYKRYQKMMHNIDKKNQLIRNSTAEFLIFTGLKTVLDNLV